MTSETRARPIYRPADIIGPMWEPVSLLDITEKYQILADVYFLSASPSRRQSRISSCNFYLPSPWGRAISYV